MKSQRLEYTEPLFDKYQPRQRYEIITRFRESRHGEIVLQIPTKSVKFLRLASLPLSLSPSPLSSLFLLRDAILLIRNNIEIQSVVPPDKSKPRRRSSSIIGLYPCSHFPLICDTKIGQDGGFRRSIPFVIVSLYFSEKPTNQPAGHSTPTTTALIIKLTRSNKHQLDSLNVENNIPTRRAFLCHRGHNKIHHFAPPSLSFFPFHKSN